MQALGFDEEANGPALSSSGHRDLERDLCSKSKTRKGKTTRFHHLPGGGELPPTPPGAWVWAVDRSAISLGWKHIQMLLRLFLETHWPDGRGAGPGSWTKAQVGEEEGADGHQVSKREGWLFFAPGDPLSMKAGLGRAGEVKPGWDLAKLSLWVGDQQPYHLSHGIF